MVHFCWTRVEVQITGSVKVPAVVHDVLHYLVQNLFKESCPDPDVFDGLGGEGLWGAAGSGGALPPQRFVAHALGSPAQRHQTVKPKRDLLQTPDSLSGS